MQPPADFGQWPRHIVTSSGTYRVFTTFLETSTKKMVQETVLSKQYKRN